MKLHTVFNSIAFFGSVALTVAPASATDPAITIGSVVSITGPAAVLGDPEATTLRIYVDKINAEGGVLGRKINLIVYDDGSDPNKARSAC